MTPEAQRIALAKREGFKIPSRKLPDYSSLDEIARVVAKLTPEQFEVFRWTLWGMVKRATVQEWNRAYLCATASQRCEAVLRALGLWVE